MNKQDDRELLELAAKAAGWTVVRWTDDDTALLLEGIQEPFNALHKNPHSDCMGDALRLAVKLGFIVDTHGAYTRISFPFGDVICTEAHGDDPCAATCRVVVRAAAAIGEAQCHM